MVIFGAPEGFDALLLARHAREVSGAVLHVARDAARLARLSDLVAYFAPDIEVLRFPAWDCLPYDRVSPAPAVVSERIATLCRLSEQPQAPRIVLTSVAAIIQRVPPPGTFEGRTLTLIDGGSLDPASLPHFLEQNGYTRSDTVMEPGEYAIRGGIIDIFPSGEPSAVRLDFFGDTVESLRYFETETQRSVAPVSSLVLRPISEIPFDPESIARFRTAWREQFGQAATSDALYQMISDGHRGPGIEHWMPLFYDKLATLTDHFGDVALSFDHQVGEALDRQLEMIEDHYEARRRMLRDGELTYRPQPPSGLYLTREEWQNMRGAPGTALEFNPFGKADDAQGIDAGGRLGPVFTQSGAQSVYAQLHTQHETWRKAGKRTIVSAWSRGSRERLAALLREHDIKLQFVDAWTDVAKIPLATIGLTTLPVERGFVGEDFGLIGEQDLLGERISRPQRRKIRADNFIAAATEIAAGDLVVHQEYGIGRYDGLETVAVGEAPHDCLRLIYDAGEKLFLPVENIELLSRYGSDTSEIALDRLGGTSWQNRKSRMKKRIRDIAAELIKTAAERRLKEGAIALPPAASWDEFCARFPFVETEDQSRAISDVLEDLASGKPMDRLICGDVGFGKTEVALRAAFVVAMTGAQVAVVVPTTLLARQHYRTFRSRFEGMGVDISLLSRMVSAKEAAATRKSLAQGDVNIVIGTHALLAKSVKFAHLGLVIIDEEQHFGVAHKERLKSMQADVHVLTLTATPIPRTLQLALTGVREMSVIATPPVDRLAVRTFIMPFDPVTLREAIQRERFRGGQIFCVVPRLEDLPRVAGKLREIVPDAKLAEAHGRLSAAELEKVMTEFGDGRYDILLSTNIVESGLDMPAVNTLIIHRADRFGLGQLYQLRGRVGRGKQRGYAYLTWPPNQAISAAAEKRLQVMQSLDTLGAGFTLASHDLDIRGAGNLLGDEQSGHVREVGIELYQQMLEDAVAEMRTERGRRRAEDREWTPNINLGLPVLIPEDYVRDLPVRLGLYRRIGALENDADSESLAAELVDRFGPVPTEVENLLHVVSLKRACRELSIEKIEAGPKGMVVQFRNGQFANPAGLVAWLGTQRGKVRLRPDHKLAVAGDLTVDERIKLARGILRELGRVAQQGKAA